MNRRVVCRRVDEDVAPKVQGSKDWTSLTYNLMLHLVTLLDNRDRSSLASTCAAWRSLGGSPYMWNNLDFRAHRFDHSAAASLANRCAELQKVRFNGLDSPAALVNLKARKLPEISGECCENVTDATLSMIVARHEALESLQLGPGFSERITSEATKLIAICCPKLKSLLLSGRRDASSEAIISFAQHCPQLSDVGFLDCMNINEEAFGKDFDPDEFEGKILIAKFNNTLNKMASILFEDNSKIPTDTMRWLEWNLSRTLLHLAENNLIGLNTFWHNHGPKLFLRLMQSSQEDVQERAATGLAAFIHMGDDNASISVMRDGGIPILLKFAKSRKESFQSEAARATANLSLNYNPAKAVAEGGVDVLLGLKEAVSALRHLSLGDAYKAIVQAVGVNVLMELLSRWSYDCGQLLERAAGALANLAGDYKCSREIAKAGGVHALVMLARNCEYKRAQEHATRILANLAAHDVSNNNNAAIGKDPRALETIIQLTRARHGGVKKEAAGALWNLAYDEKNRGLIAALGGVEASVALANSCLNTTRGLQKSATGALWCLSHSEENSIVIGHEGGMHPLVSLARSQFKDVHEAAAGALWNLSFNHVNALRIVEEGGVLTLGRLCTTSPSKMARFLAALTLAYIVDGRLDERVKASPGERKSKSVRLAKVRRSAHKYIERFIKTFMEPKIIKAAASSYTPSKSAQVLKEVCIIPEAANLRCTGEEIGRFVKMLCNPSPALQKIAAFALLQFTIPEASQAKHHASLMRNAGYPRLLRFAAVATSMPREAKVFAKMVLRNLEYHHQPECSEGTKVINFQIGFGRLFY